MKVIAFRTEGASPQTSGKAQAAKFVNTPARPGRPPSPRTVERKRQADKARAAMVALRFSQRQVAKSLDEHQTTVARMLAGKTELGRTELVVMARRGCKRLALALVAELMADVEAA